MVISQAKPCQFRLNGYLVTTFIIVMVISLLCKNVTTEKDKLSSIAIPEVTHTESYTTLPIIAKNKIWLECILFLLALVIIYFLFITGLIHSI
jgi:hypothetical protein